MVCFVQVREVAINLDLVKRVEFENGDVRFVYLDGSDAVLTDDDAVHFYEWWSGHSGVHICPEDE